MERDQRLAKQLDRLERELGAEIILVDEEGVDRDTRYRILRELDLGGKHYAVLQAADVTEPEAYVFRVTGAGENCRIEHIEDDTEWDQVAEAIDEMLYFDET
ncbi:DUF1292 domain-containing protein [Paludifilum halophilum]|nr:DUF1292 domain-containing protein [Paludifilum halophilum]